MVDYFCSYVVTVLRPQISSPKQRGLVGGQRGGRGQKTQWLGWWLRFPFPPAQDPLKGLDVDAARFFFPGARPVFLREKSNLG